MADVDFFWDPVCPWAWITSRWIVEVQGQRDLDVDWRPISLKIVNEAKEHEQGGEYPHPSHTLGLQLLRVAVATREGHGRERLGDLYTAFGTKIHVDRDRASLSEPEGVSEILRSLDLPTTLAEAAGDGETWDGAVRADTKAALVRAGEDVGTPVITFAPPDGPSFFGPVISRIPRGPEALELWDSTERIARFPGFSELKRSLREPPQVA